MMRTMIGQSPLVPRPAPSPWGPTVTGTTLGKAWAHAYVRDGWTGPWQLVPYLQPLRSVEAVFPQRSTADFLYRYGDIKWEDRSTNVHWLPEIGLDLYVCIRVIPEKGFPFISWVGVIPAEQLQVFGTRVDQSGVTRPAGDQTMTAYGLEYLLERRQVPGAWVRIPEPEEPPDPPEENTGQQIGWSPPFNQRYVAGLQDLGNRTADKLLEGGVEVAYGFGGSSVWSHRDIVEYLLYYSNPSLVEITEPDFKLAPTAEAEDPEIIAFFDAMQSRVTHEGRNVSSVLASLIDRSRGLGARIAWSVLPGGAQGEGGFPGGPVELELFSMTDLAIAIGDVTLPANPLREHIALDSGLETEHSLVVVDAMATYDYLRVQGARVLSCFSVCTQNLAVSTDRVIVEPDWEPTVESEYYAADDLVRETPHFDRVWQRFRLPDDFDWTTVVQPNGQLLNPVFGDNAEIDFSTAAPYMNAGHVWRRRLPLAVPGTEDATEPTYQAPFILFQIFEDGDDQYEWMMGEKPREDHVACQFTLVDQGLAMDIRYRPNHYHARTHFLGDTKVSPKLDYDAMIATVCLETDTRPAVNVLLGAPGVGRNRTLTITLPDVEMWIIATGTVLGINTEAGGDGLRGLDVYRGTRILRDDTARLRHVAALAKAVYGTHRKAVNVRYRGLRLDHPLGTYVIAAWADQVRHGVESVVTQRVMDYENNRTAVKTGFIELDFARSGM